MRCFQKAVVVYSLPRRTNIANTLPCPTNTGNTRRSPAQIGHPIHCPTNIGNTETSNIGIRGQSILWKNWVQSRRQYKENIKLRPPKSHISGAKQVPKTINLTKTPLSRFTDAACIRFKYTVCIFIRYALVLGDPSIDVIQAEHFAFFES